MIIWHVTTEQDNKAQTCTDSRPIDTVIVNHAIMLTVKKNSADNIYVYLGHVIY